jgi:hypothetical protein
MSKLEYWFSVLEFCYHTVWLKFLPVTLAEIISSFSKYFYFTQKNTVSFTMRRNAEF